MSIRLDNPWQKLSAQNVEALTAHLGVYAIRDAGGTFVRIGFAGGRSLFGLRGALADELARRPDDGFEFTTEINMQYTSRYAELLMVYVADHGDLPADNRDDPPPRLGRLSPL